MTQPWRLVIGLVFTLALAGGLCCGEATLEADRQWGQWRGPSGNGFAPHGDPPIDWSDERNVGWKVELPGRGQSTPIVWGDRVFVTTAIPTGERLSSDRDAHEHDDGAHDNVEADRRLRFVVMALRRSDGTVSWEKTVRTEKPHEPTHVTGSWASASPVTDGKRLYAFFGSRGLYAFNLDGQLVWEKDLGDMQVRHAHGEGSSPALWGDTLVVNWDHQGDSFVVALDARTGKQKWKRERDEITSWSTPFIIDHAGKPQVIISATGKVRGYDLASGEVVWECSGLSRNVVASPVGADGFVYVGNSYDWRAMMGIRLEGARGDITGTDHVAWKIDRHTPYVPSPVLADDRLCFLRHNQAVLSCLEAKSGRPLLGPVRLPAIRDVFASPVVAASRLYVASRNGTTLVLALGDELDLLSTNELDDSFSASPAIVDRELYLRGERYLYQIVADDAPTRAAEPKTSP